MNRVADRLAALRECMRREQMDAYVIPTGDYHNSEYVGDYFKVREYYSGFTGSNGTLVVLEQEAGLWTDGRYFIQAENELAGSGITLYRMGEEGVPTVYEYLEQKLEEGMVVGADGNVLSTSSARKIEKLQEAGIGFRYEKDLGGRLWKDRGMLPCEPVRILPEKLCGNTISEKLQEVRKRLSEQKCTGFFLNKLDDIMWLFQIRGNDIVYNPVSLSYAYITMEHAVLFLQKAAYEDSFLSYADQNGFTVEEYEQVIPFLREKIKKEDVILCDERHMTYRIYDLIAKQGTVKNAPNPTELLKAKKNKTEQEKLCDIYIKDSVAVTRFIYWLKNTIGREAITEISAAQKLQSLRMDIPEYLEDSFETISAYKANAAMMHYEPSDENPVYLEQQGLLLVDSGGQYLGGTTDVTRTIVLGEISEEIKKHYTWTSIGMLHLSKAKFLSGCTGRNLDILAREKLWEHGMDYKCGTGHGVGYILNVHEGPQAIRWRQSMEEKEAPFEEGMLITNEPGVYIEGSHGIRIENVMLCKKDEKSADGQFLKFDTLTFVPLDPDGIDADEMSPLDIFRYNEYQKQVFDRISQYLPTEEAEWLKKVTKPIKTY